MMAQPVMQQPQMGMQQPTGGMMMNTTINVNGGGGGSGVAWPGLFDCFDDIEVCLCGYCCGICLIGKVAQLRCVTSSEHRASESHRGTQQRNRTARPICAGQTHERAGLKSGPSWKIPTMFVCGGVLTYCCGWIAQVVAFYWMVEGRGKIMKHAGQPDEGIPMSCLTYCCCVSLCAVCQVRQASPCPTLPFASALADTQNLMPTTGGQLRQQGMGSQRAAAS